MKNKFYIVTDIETHEKSDQIEWEILNCLGIWSIEGGTKQTEKLSYGRRLRNIWGLS